MKGDSTEPLATKRQLPFNLLSELDLAILKCVLKHKTIASMELSKEIGLSRVNSGSHIKKLRFYGLLNCEASSTYRFISLTKMGRDFLESDLAKSMVAWADKEQKRRKGRSRQRFLLKRYLKCP